MEWLIPDRTYAEIREAGAWRELDGEAGLPQKDAGYHFQHPAVLRNVPPPTVIVDRPLRWWSLDRPRRLAMAMRLRDRLQEEILKLGNRTDHLTART